MNPTPYPQINALLHALLTNVQATLGQQVVGLYLYGSLADGDFRPASSDIDFVVLTREPLAAAVVAALGEMHGRFAGRPNKWATKIEGSYVPLADIARYDPDGGPYPQINESRFFVAGHGADWIIQRRLLRRRGIVVAGPPIAPLIVPVTDIDLCRAVKLTLQHWWAPMLSGDNRLHEAPYQAFAILTMCRARCTLATGTAVSKTGAARWAFEHLHARWQPLIDLALAWPQGSSTIDQQSVVGFIRDTLQQAGLDG